MLPARPRHAVRLADVLTDSLAALNGQPSAIGLPRLRHVIVVLVDGLGAAALRERAGHARTLAGRLNRRSVADSVFPSTTAAALATLTTGVDPLSHGLVGYSVLDPANDRVLNLLRGWDDRAVPERWQAAPTVFERAGGPRDAEGAPAVSSIAIGPTKYAGSTFGRAILRGADYLGVDWIAARTEAALAHARSAARTLAYVYVPELDTAAHRSGLDSDAWIGALETVDSAVREAALSLGSDTALLVTADHGVVDVPARSHLLIPPGALSGVRHVAGEPRGLQLHLEPHWDAEAVAETVRDEIGDTGWVITRDEALAEGLFGRPSEGEDPDPEIVARIGDVIVGARKRVAFYTRDDDPARRMIGQHGSLSEEELTVPLLRFGAGAD